MKWRNNNLMWICVLMAAITMLTAADITKEAALTSQANAKNAERIRDGRVDASHFLPGSNYLKRFNGWGDTFTFTWPKPMRITGVTFIQKAPPVVLTEYGKATRGAVYAIDNDGKFTIPLILPHAAKWQEEKRYNTECEVLAYTGLNIVTTALEVSFVGGGGKWSQLGEIMIEGWPDDQPPPGAVLAAADITKEAALTSQANPKNAERIRDGRVDANHFLPGSNYLKRFNGWGDTFTFTWPKPMRITGVTFIQKSPPVVLTEYGKATRGAVYAIDNDGKFTIPLILPHAAKWQEEKRYNTECEVLAYTGLNIVTTALEVSFVGSGGKWSQLGEIMIEGNPADQPPPGQPPAAKAAAQDKEAANPRSFGALEIRSENPWLNTRGGTLVSPAPEQLEDWPLAMPGGDTEQRFIALTNTSGKALSFKVALESTLPGSADASLLVAVPQKTREHGDALLNLFSAEQLAAFKGALPPSFLRQEQYRRFPEIELAGGDTVRIWLRVRSFDVKTGKAAPAGNYQVALTGMQDGKELFRQVVPVKVIPAQIPRHPSLQVMPYGGVDDEDSRLHYSTINDGFRDYGFRNFLAATNLWNQQKDLAALAENNPAQLREIVAEALERYYQYMRKLGFQDRQILVEILDEPFDRSADRWLAFARAIKEVRPDAKIIANPPAHWPEGNMPTTLEKTFKPIAPYVDVWMPYSRHYENPEVREFLKSENKPLWFYNNCAVQTARKEDAIVSTYRRFGWLGIRYNLDGIGFWSAHSPVGDQWDDFDKTAFYTWPDPAIVFKSDAGAVTTRHWESWRETVEDIELYRMVKNAMDMLELPPALRQEMQQWLEQSPAIMLENPTPEKIQSIRNQAVKLLDRE